MKIIKLFLALITMFSLLLFNCNTENKNGKKEIESKWIFKTINGKEVLKEKAGSGIPYLILNLNGNSLSGFTGCNDLDGKISITDSKIIFSDMSVSKMYCSDAEYEFEIINFLFHSEPVNYKIENNLLILSKSEKNEMIFKKEE